jgi:hypothetical protein
MHPSRFLLASSVLFLAACGSTDGDTAPVASPVDPGEKKSEGSHYDYGAKFEPAAPVTGYTRFVAPVVRDIAPGADITYCQYVMAPTDKEIDILRVTGVQSAGGHHTVAFATSKDVVGQSEECVDGEMEAGFLGGTGGDGAAIELPENTAFRLPTGSGIMLSNHFINTSDDFITGESVLDLQIVDVDPTRRVAGLFAVMSSEFDIPARGKAHTKQECVLEKDLEIFALTNHMHEYGTSASSRMIQAPGMAPRLVSDIPAWSPEMTGNPQWQMYLGEDTLKLPKGAMVDVECNWENTSASPLTFPREMCLTVGFFFAKTATSLACNNGTWVDISPQL